MASTNNAASAGATNLTAPLDQMQPLGSLTTALPTESKEAEGTAVAATADNDDAEDEEDDVVDENAAPVNPLSDDESEDEENTHHSEVQLGFLEEPYHPTAMLRHYFPAKAGGKPAWLNPKNLPSPQQLTCVHCKNPMIFLLQLYAPLRSTHGAHPGSFHRTLFLFCCMDESCTNKQSSVVCLRSQLPRINPFYPDVAPPKLDEYPLGDDEPLPVYEDAVEPGVHLCCVCGNPAPSSCSRCHARWYCSKLHQAHDWKKGGHKTKCQPPPADGAAAAAADASASPTESAPAPPAPASLLFPQMEVIIEPEEDEAEPAKANKMSEDPKVKQLLEAYEKQKAEEGDEEEDEEEVADAVQNWSSPKLKDPAFLKFKARIGNAPEQVLRYDRGEGPERHQPIWVSSWFQPASPPMPDLPKVGLAAAINGQQAASGQAKASPAPTPTPLPRPPVVTAAENDAAIPPCPHCGGLRRFEFQVLPQLLHYLGANTASLDFANLVVYTCEASCGDGTKQYFQEHTWVQAHAQ